MCPRNGLNSELRSQYSFMEFQERRQMIGRNPNMSILDNKLKLRTTLQAYVYRLTRCPSVPSQPPSQPLPTTPTQLPNPLSDPQNPLPNHPPLSLIHLPSPLSGCGYQVLDATSVRTAA